MTIRAEKISKWHLFMARYFGALIIAPKAEILKYVRRDLLDNISGSAYLWYCPQHDTFYPEPNSAPRWLE